MAQVSDKRYGNWVKDTLCLLYVKEGLVTFINNQSTTFHTQLKVTIGNSTCPCRTQVITREKKRWAVRHCNGLCQDWLDRILSHHRLKPPIIPTIVPGNTNPQLWPIDCWEVMKVFQPKGCQDQHSASDADIAALLCLMNNCDHFFQFYSHNRHLIDQVMCARDRLMHSNDFLVEDLTLDDDVQKMLTFLRSLTSLSATERLSIDTAIDKIEELHSKALDLSLNRELELNAIRASQVALQAEMRNLEQTVQDVTMDTKTVSSGLASVNNKVDKEVSGLRNKVDNEVLSLKNIVGTTVLDYQTKINTDVLDLKNKMDMEVSGLANKMDCKVTSVKDKVDTEVSDLKNKVDSDISGLHDKIDTKVSGTHDKIDAEVTSLKDNVNTDILVLQLRLQTHMSRIEELQQELTTQHQSTGNTIYSLTRLQEQFDGLASDLEQVKDKVATLNQNTHQAKPVDIDGLQHKLIRMYRSQKRHVPLYLLGPERKVPLKDIYVEQQLKIVDPDGKLTTKASSKSDKYVSSLKDVFYADGIKCQYIYISGNAGYGKSVFCSHIVSLWCTAHLEKKTRKLTKNEEMMAEFPLLFCVDLRDVTEDESDQSQDEIAFLIKRQLRLSELGLTDDGLRDLLQADGQVLVLMDALDECKLNRVINVGLFNMCTFLVTSRPWKLEVLRCDKELRIDQELEIVGLKKASFVELSDKLVNILNKKWQTSKNLSDFIKTITKKGLEEFLSIPVLHKSLICLWFDDKPLGNSLSSVYSNLIHHQLLIAIHGKTLSSTSSGSETPFLFPVCPIEECPCKPFAELLWKVSELAFKTLLGSARERSLVMDHDQTILLGLSDEDVDLCMKIGILTQYKLLGNTTDYKAQKYVSFTHKTFQEWFCALYLATIFDKAELSKLFSDIIYDLNSTLELEKMFLFLCGLNANVAAEFSDLIMEKVSLDLRVQDYRRLSSYICSKGDALIMRIQDVIVAGLVEARKNHKPHVTLKLHDIYISTRRLDKSFSSDQILSCDTSDAKSVYIDGQPDIMTWPSSPCVENVVLRDVDLTHCLTFHENFAINKMKILHMKNVAITHVQIECLCKSLGLVENLHIERIICNTHKAKTDECIIKLDFSKQNETKVLKYAFLKGYTTHLTAMPSCPSFEVDFYDIDISYCDTFIQHVSTSPLSKLRLHKVTMTHEQIQSLFTYFNFADKRVDVSLTQTTCITHLQNRESCSIECSISCHKDVSAIEIPSLGEFAPEVKILAWPSFSFCKTIQLSRVDITLCEEFSKHFPASRLEFLHMSKVIMTHDQMEHLLNTLDCINHRIDNLICKTHRGNINACNIQIDLSHYENLKTSIQGTLGLIYAQQELSGGVIKSSSQL